MKPTAIFVIPFIWVFLGSGEALASDCEIDKITLEVEMTGLNLHKTEMKGAISQIEAANGTNNDERTIRLQKDVVEAATKIIEIATEILYVLDSMDKDPTNCGFSQIDLDDFHAQMTTLIGVARKIRDAE